MDILTTEQINQINEASLQVLSSVGVKVDHQKVFTLLRQAGAEPDKHEMKVKMPPDLVKECLNKCPKTVRLANLSGEVTELRAGLNTVFWTGNALYLIEGRERKPMDSQSFVDLVRVIDALDNVHGMVGTSINDYPANTRDFVGFRLMAENTTKHLRPVIFTPQGALAILEMSEVLLNGKTIKENPIFSLGYTIVSPLHWSYTALDLFIKSSGYGIPIMVNAEPLAGCTAPVTLAGCLVAANAEALSGLVILQILEEGRPCIFNLGFSHTMDMHTAISLTGRPECALLAAGGAQIARFHQLPSASWMSTESLLSDSQAAYEKMLTGLMHALSQVNIIWGVGQLESQLALSLEQAVIDNEIAGMIRRAQRGIEVNPETLALEVIKEIGFNAEYLSHEHTLKHFRDELSFAQLGSRTRRELWEKEGKKSIEEKAKEKVRQILTEEKKERLPEDQIKKLREIEKNWLKRMNG